MPTINTTPTDHIPEEFTAESLKAAGLTEQEISYLADGDDPVIPPINDDDDAAKAGGDDDDIPGDIGQEPKVAETPKAQEEAPQATPAPDEPKPVQIPDTTEAEAIVSAYDAAVEKAQDDYDNGDLSQAEFRQKIKDLNAAQIAAQAEIDQATNVITRAQQQAVQHWEDRINAYKATAPQLWDDAHIGQWDRHLREVTGSQAYVNLTRDQQIRLAHTRYAAEYEAIRGTPLPIPLPGATNVQPDPAKDKKLEQRTDPRPEPPTTLAGINADTAEAIASSRFAQIDKQALDDPIKAEEMLNALPPSEREAFLRMQ